MKLRPFIGSGVYLCGGLASNTELNWFFALSRMIRQPAEIFLPERGSKLDQADHRPGRDDSRTDCKPASATGKIVRQKNIVIPQPDSVLHGRGFVTGTAIFQDSDYAARQNHGTIRNTLADKLHKNAQDIIDGKPDH